MFGRPTLTEFQLLQLATIVTYLQCWNIISKLAPSVARWQSWVKFNGNHFDFTTAIYLYCSRDWNLVCHAISMFCPCLSLPLSMSVCLSVFLWLCHECGKRISWNFSCHCSCNIQLNCSCSCSCCSCTLALWKTFHFMQLHFEYYYFFLLLLSCFLLLAQYSNDTQTYRLVTLPVCRYERQRNSDRNSKILLVLKT